MFFFYRDNALFRESGTLVPKGWKIILPTAVGHQTAGTQKSQNPRLNFGLCSTDLPKMQSQMSSFYCEYKSSFLAHAYCWDLCKWINEHISPQEKWKIFLTWWDPVQEVASFFSGLEFVFVCQSYCASLRARLGPHGGRRVTVHIRCYLRLRPTLTFSSLGGIFLLVSHEHLILRSPFEGYVFRSVFLGHPIEMDSLDTFSYDSMFLSFKTFIILWKYIIYICLLLISSSELCLMRPGIISIWLTTANMVASIEPGS